MLLAHPEPADHTSTVGGVAFMIWGVAGLGMWRCDRAARGDGANGDARRDEHAAGLARGRARLAARRWDRRAQRGSRARALKRTAGVPSTIG